MGDGPVLLSQKDIVARRAYNTARVTKGQAIVTTFLHCTPCLQRKRSIEKRCSHLQGVYLSKIDNL